MTHEQYIHKVREIVVNRLESQDERDLLMRAKLCYGRGNHQARGVTCYSAWDGRNSDDDSDNGIVEFVEICATGEESPIQVAGTVVHELGHVLAGLGAGHDKHWKETCHKLGLVGAKATGTIYENPDVWDEGLLVKIQELGEPVDGRPHKGIPGIPGLGIAVGMRTGKSGCATGKKAQKGRLRLYECGCDPVIKIRAAKDDLEVMCLKCGSVFKQVEVVTLVGNSKVTVPVEPVEGEIKRRLELFESWLDTKRSKRKCRKCRGIDFQDPRNHSARCGTSHNGKMVYPVESPYCNHRICETCDGKGFTLGWASV